MSEESGFSNDFFETWSQEENSPETDQFVDCEDEHDCAQIDDIKETESKESGPGAESSQEPTASERKAEIARLKDAGNSYYKSNNFPEAINSYDSALLRVSGDDAEIAAICLSNRAACLLSLNRAEEALKDATESTELNPNYAKAFIRRFRCNERLEKWHDAVADLQTALKLEPALAVTYKKALADAELKSKEQFEREKEELMDKLKTFGNWALGKVGLSLDNFKLDQNENGSYNIQFVQNQ